MNALKERERKKIWLAATTIQWSFILIGSVMLFAEGSFIWLIVLELSVTIGFIGAFVYPRFSGKDLYSVLVFLLFLQVMLILFHSSLLINLHEVCVFFLQILFMMQEKKQKEREREMRERERQQLSREISNWKW